MQGWLEIHRGCCYGVREEGGTCKGEGEGEGEGVYIVGIGA